VEIANAGRAIRVPVICWFDRRAPAIEMIRALAPPARVQSVGLGVGLGLVGAGLYGAYAYPAYYGYGCYPRRIWTPYGWRLLQFCG
jgi:hypothetical protein